jgi:hypothetical protein
LIHKSGRETTILARVPFITTWLKNLDLGVEVMFNHLNTGFGGNAIVNAAVAEPTQNFQVKDQSVVAAIFRAQRNFWP